MRSLCAIIVCDHLQHVHNNKMLQTSLLPIEVFIVGESWCGGCSIYLPVLVIGQEGAEFPGGREEEPGCNYCARKSPQQQMN